MKPPLIMAAALALAVFPATAQARPWGGPPREAHAERPPAPDFRYGGVDEGDMRRGYGRDDGPMMRTAMDEDEPMPPPPEMRPPPALRGWMARLFGDAPRARGRGRHRPHW